MALDGGAAPEILSNVVLSQIEEHAAFGGVVPEIAARAHVEALDGIVEAALADSSVSLDEVEKMLAAIHHVPTGQALACERAFLAALDGSCRTPIAGHATVAGEKLSFAGLIISPDGSQSHEVRLEGEAADAAEIGLNAARTVRARAGAEFFDGWA
ncbi:hypothetical protein [Mesorhizobium sp.]|uniref:hypothetical protein n=1 Tax=Mesorhizobium sp. TaxID=1871066 RepID=UPI0025BAF5D5|nr:hypothetical protein [Mesorhizobium sp.]